MQTLLHFYLGGFIVIIFVIIFTSLYEPYSLLSVYSLGHRKRDHLAALFLPVAYPIFFGLFFFLILRDYYQERRRKKKMLKEYNERIKNEREIDR